MVKRGWSCGEMNRQPTENPRYVLDAPARGHKEPRKTKDEMDNFIHERNFSTYTCPAKRGQVSLNRECLRPMTLIQRLPETELN